jgi:hypothetical protein
VITPRTQGPGEVFIICTSPVGGRERERGCPIYLSLEYKKASENKKRPTSMEKQLA